MKNVVILENPFILDALSHLRDKHTVTEKFRLYSDKLSELLVSQSLVGIALEKVEVETPLSAKAQTEKLSENIIIIPIFRAGIAMLPAVVKLLPASQIGFVGLEREEKTAIAREYYFKIPKITDQSVVLITDPMLATGGSMIHVLRKLGKVKEVRVLCVIAAPEGIAAIHQEFPHVIIITACVDEYLNSQKFIVPGLGDYGDRYFGTI